MEDDYAAFCLDQAIAYWGRHLENEMDRAEQECKDAAASELARKRVLDKYFPRSEDEEIRSGTFADPAAMFG